jgi:hypothetical protein
MVALAAYLKPGRGQRLERHNDEHQPFGFVDDVLDDEGRHGRRPESFPLGDEIAKRLAELRVKAKAGVDFLDGIENLLAETTGHRFS